MSPVRVLLICPNLSSHGGQAVQASRLQEGFAQQPNVRMTVLVFDHALPPWLRGIPVLRTLCNALIYWTNLLIRLPRHDVVHVFTAAYWGFLLWTTPAVLLARLWHRPVIVNYRDGRCADHLKYWPGATHILRLASGVVTPSGFLVEVMRQFGVRAWSISNMIDLEKFPFRRREPLQPVFLSNRALEPLYNVECILRAFGSIQGQRPEARLIIAHDGPCRPALVALAAELGLRQVEWRGKVDAREMAGLYDECDVYLNAPVIDNMPGSLLECLASGVLIVSTDVGGIPFIVKHEESALLVSSNDAPAMAAAALRLWVEPELARRLIVQGREACSQYAPEQVLGAWTELYIKLQREDR